MSISLPVLQKANEIFQWMHSDYNNKRKTMPKSTSPSWSFLDIYNAMYPSTTSSSSLQEDRNNLLQSAMNYLIEKKEITFLKTRKSINLRFVIRSVIKETAEESQRNDLILSDYSNQAFPSLLITTSNDDQTGFQIHQKASIPSESTSYFTIDVSEQEIIKENDDQGIENKGLHTSNPYCVAFSSSSSSLLKMSSEKTNKETEVVEKLSSLEPLLESGSNSDVAQPTVNINHVNLVFQNCLTKYILKEFAGKMNTEDFKTAFKRELIQHKVVKDPGSMSSEDLFTLLERLFIQTYQMFSFQGFVEEIHDSIWLMKYP
jgi:hypothetical protein